MHFPKPVHVTYKPPQEVHIRTCSLLPWEFIQDAPAAAQIFDAPVAGVNICSNSPSSFQTIPLKLCMIIMRIMSTEMFEE